MSYRHDYRRAVEYEARCRIQEALVCEDEATRQSAVDELMHLDRALHAGRILSHDWTGPLGMPMPAPQFAPPRLPRPRMACRMVELAREAWHQLRAFGRRMPDAIGYASLIVGAAITWVLGIIARDFHLWALSWQVVLMASVEMATMPPLPHHEAPAEAIAFELDLANPEAFTAVAPF